MGGLVELTWSEIRAFIEVNELELTLWERGMIKKMSHAYCREASAATDENRPAPYQEQREEDEVDHVAIALQIAANMRAFRKKR